MDQAVVSADEAFFEALRTADVGTLRRTLTDDFVIVDVMGGQVTASADLLAVIGSGELVFVEVTNFGAERIVRVQDRAAVVVGRTRMRMRYLGQEATASSRYTHVFRQDGNGWRLWSAQGTPIPEQP
jgi:ketosteroid isomerase-like protein